MARKIFISYRRGDEAGFTLALYQLLEHEFAAGDIFMDIEGHIRPGDDFVQILNSWVTVSDVVLVVIGPRWAELIKKRWGDPDDFVAIEIKAALDQRKRVIPILVGNAEMPRADTLPEAIRQLAYHHAITLRPERFKADCLGIISALKDKLSTDAKERIAKAQIQPASTASYSTVGAILATTWASRI